MQPQPHQKDGDVRGIHLRGFGRVPLAYAAKTPVQAAAIDHADHSRQLHVDA